MKPAGKHSNKISCRINSQVTDVTSHLELLEHKPVNFGRHLGFVINDGVPLYLAEIKWQDLLPMEGALGEHQSQCIIRWGWRSPNLPKGPLHPVCPHRVSTSPQNVSRGRIKKIHEGAESLSSLFNRDALYYSREGGPSIEILQRLASDLHSPRVRDSLKQTSGQKHFLTVIFSPFQFLISYAMWRIASTQGKRNLRKV